MKKYAWLLLLLLISCQKEREINNIANFAKLYGYVRWFHPSDEAQQINWNKFAVLGVQKVRNIRSTSVLKDTLFRLFSPIVPGLQIYEPGEPGKGELQIPVMDGKVVAWQHYGVSLGLIDHLYKSIRSNLHTVSDFKVGKVRLNVASLTGKKIKFSGYLKRNGKEHQSVLYLFPVLESNLYFPAVSNKIAITSTEWEKYELTMTVPERSASIEYGVMLNGDAEVWADDFQLAVDNNGTWEMLDDENMSFENGEIDRYASDWNTDAGYYDVAITDHGSYSGKYCMKAAYKGTMFDPMPRAGETVREPIGNRLHCLVPLTLYTTDGKSTYPKPETCELNRLKNELANTTVKKKEFNPDVNLASIIVAWNVFQHFFPYMDIIDIDWDQELCQTLRSTLGNTDQKEFALTLDKMIAKLQDGHGRVNGERKYYLPAEFDCIEDHIVVTSSRDTALQRGDIVKKIDGENACNVLAELESTISGSPQLKRYRALRTFGNKYTQEETNIEIERNQRTYHVTIAIATTGGPYPYVGVCPYSGVRELEPGIFYVNLRDCTGLDEKITELAEAKAVIYDGRDGGGMLFKIIPHLTEKPLRMADTGPPQIIIYPDRKDWAYEDLNDFHFNPQKPTFKSRSIVITAPSILSSGESEMSLIDYYGLAVTVGSVTGGCNGDLNLFSLPCGYTVMFTGKKVLKHDGTQLYLNGYEPDYPVFKTLQGFMEERDLYLEKAMEIARNN